MTRVLVVSFSFLRRDPRVLRQIDLLIQHGYQVLTIGFGEAPDGVAAHFDAFKKRAGYNPLPVKIARRTKELLSSRKDRYWANYPALLSRKWIKQNASSFDAVLTNDVLAVPIGVESGKPFHADLHEYAIGQGTSLKWRLTVLPLVKWAAPLLVKAQSTSTVAPGLAAKYEETYGIMPFVVNNAPNYQPDIEPTPTSTPIRLVHMGAAGRPRSLEMPIHAVQKANQEVPGRFTLDYYLVPGEQAYIEELRQLAGNPAVTGITIHDPVPFDQIIPTLHQHDAALAFFPPTTVNLKHTLPNKFFEAVQARIGVITGPSPEMGPYIHEYGFGTTTTGWTQEDLDQTINSLTPQTINTWKQAANKAAPHLGAEQQDQKWLAAVSALTGAD